MGAIKSEEQIRAEIQELTKDKTPAELVEMIVQVLVCAPALTERPWVEVFKQHDFNRRPHIPEGSIVKLATADEIARVRRSFENQERKK